MNIATNISLESAVPFWPSVHSVTCDAREHYQTQFMSKIWAWQIPKLFISGLNLGKITQLAAQLHKNQPNFVFMMASDPWRNT